MRTREAAQHVEKPLHVVDGVIRWGTATADDNGDEGSLRLRLRLRRIVTFLLTVTGIRHAGDLAILEADAARRRGALAVRHDTVAEAKQHAPRRGFPIFFRHCRQGGQRGHQCADLLRLQWLLPGVAQPP